MRKILLGAAALGALGILTVASPADAAPRKAAGVQPEQAIDLSAVHRPRHLRRGSRWVAPRYRYVRPYRYYARPAPYWGGYPYYARPYYYRPYYRPYAPFPFLPFFW
jgi:hypothetical protein